jgi:hypothetical protein
MKIILLIVFISLPALARNLTNDFLRKTEGHKSLFASSISLIRTGCLETVCGKCVGPRLYNGPYDLSDGMVPFASSQLPDAVFVLLKGADHGETVVRIPYRGYDQKRLTSALFKLLL